MSDKTREKNTHNNHDLDREVAQRLEQDSDFEAKMIANFNANVNSTQHHEKVKKTNLNPVKESGGPAGLEPTRYGDWERKGRCSDF